MNTIEEKLTFDRMMFGQSIIKDATLRTFRQRIWGAWKVITGEAGIIMVRVPPDKVYKEIK